MFFNKETKEESKRIVDMLTVSHNEWVVNQYLAKHNPTNIVFWVGNGFAFFKVDDRSSIKFRITRRQRKRLWNWLVFDSGRKEVLKKLSEHQELRLRQLLANEK